MKLIKYQLNGHPVEMGWNESNEEIAKREADDGIYTIEDDGQFEPETAETTSLEDRVGALESDTADLADALGQVLASGVLA